MDTMTRTKLSAGHYANTETRIKRLARRIDALDVYLDTAGPTLTAEDYDTVQDELMDLQAEFCEATGLRGIALRSLSTMDLNTL